MAFGSADGRVVIDTQLNNKGFIKGVKGLEGQLGGLRSVVGKLGAVISTAFAVHTLVNFGRECVELGSNVAEVQNVVDTAFGDIAYKVEAFANGAIRNFGMSRLAAKKTASTYMAMAKGMGVADDAASDMSITLAGLTGDVASFYNISQELADIKLKSVFTGETETLKDLGVVMTLDNLKAYALSQGITKSYEAMSQAEKVALRYNFVLDSLALANGDFARTSNSWANQTRILSMQWQEFMSIIGQALITVLTPAVRVLNEIVAGLISIANTFNAVVSGLFGGPNTQMEQTQAAASGVSGAISESVDNQNALTDATEETARAQQKALAGFDEINKLSGESAGGAATAGIGAATPVGVSTYEVEVAASPASERILGFFDTMKTVLQPTIDALKHLKEAAEPLNEHLFSGLDWALENVFKPLGTWVGGEALPAFLGVLAGVCDLLAAAVEILSPWAAWLWTEFLQPIASWTGGVIVTVLQEISDLLRDISDVISGELSLGDFIEDLSPIQTVLMGIATAMVAIAIASAGMAGLSAVTTFIKDVRNLKAAGVIGKLAEVFVLTSSGAGTLSEAMKAVFGPGSIIAGIAGVIGGAVIAVTNFISMLQNGFSWANEALMLLGIALGGVGAIILGAPAMVAGVIAAIVAAVATAVIVIKDNWESLKAFFSRLWDNIKAVFAHVSDWFEEKFTSAWTAVKNVFSAGGEIFDGIKDGILDGLTAVVNALITGINKVIAVPFNGINRALLKIKGVDILGLKPFDWIRTISVPKIPKLAQGAVIPPNREFLAVLGDQKSGTNIETPLSTMKQAFLEAMQESGGASGGTFKFEIYLNGRKMAVEMVKEVNSMTRAAGKPVLLF